MIFIRYENWRTYLKSYPVTCLILAINIVMFVLTAVGPEEAILEYGAMINREPYTSEWWRFVASIFLHFNFGHLFSNSFGILIFTPPMERLLGSWRYVLLYLGSGIVGNLITMGIYQHSSMVHISAGASGAIYGIYGAFLYVALFQRQFMDEASRKTLYSLLIVGIVFSFLVPQVNWIAHLGGFIGGFFIYGLIIRLLKRR
ncbi:rhomboid family intramembrane serine protease [Paenibacillus sp. FSL W8-0186]|uniref:rhomboid family intramembrane serine protease n=1 Tax=Paenibacillus sp. FSL W8-0186 TaxID=2921709 RepID=UPI0030D03B20